MVQRIYPVEIRLRPPRETTAEWQAQTAFSSLLIGVTVVTSRLRALARYIA